MDWQLALAFGALVVGAIGFLSRSLDKGLSIREHEEFRQAMFRQITDIQASYRRECDRLEERIKVLEQTRPTTGEIEAKLAPPDEPNGRFRLSRSIDLAALVALAALTGTAIFTFFSGYSGVTAQQVKLDAKFELLDQRAKNDEAIAADKRALDTAFAAEMRAGLAQLAQSVADLRTLVASQDNAKRH